ncbi:hypothetical protein GOP47_0008501 [Adiantum capillus-veneris]|uniref:NB-ARC domain-containing protein n=1 Tax=Adiantum capillus-veneris TaxID=13818 RepID=A0A9D4ZKH4_ADICA|nr:hypothetical protein GOP47_0008501 [Adiantum capillus-veneris]
MPPAHTLQLWRRASWLALLAALRQACIPPATQPLLWQSATLPTRPDGDATIIDIFLGNLDVEDPITADDDPAEDEDSHVDDDLHATKADVVAAGAATLAAMPFVNHAEDDAAAAVGPTSTPSDADAAATVPATLDATAADEVRAASDATMTDVTPAAQPADEPTAVNIAITPLELPTATAKKDALVVAVTTSVAIIATIVVVANLVAIKTDGTHVAVALVAIPAEAPTADEVNPAAIEEAVAVGNLAVDNDPDAKALADGPRGDKPTAAKIAASLAEEDEATQDAAEIVAAPNLAIDRVLQGHLQTTQVFLTSWPSIAFDPGGHVDATSRPELLSSNYHLTMQEMLTTFLDSLQQAVCLNALVLPISILIYQVANLYNLLYYQYTLSSTLTNTPKDGCAQDSDAQKDLDEKSSLRISAQQRRDETHVPHDIFLSHSGAQKGFVKDLYEELRRNTFTTFLDIEYHSLPPGEHFPEHILKAAKSYAMASCSSDSLRLFPLFFKLGPRNLKCTRNLERWREAWRAHAEQDSKHRIDVSKWEDALEKLCSQNGISFEQASEGEQRASKLTSTRLCLQSLKSYLLLSSSIQPSLLAKTACVRSFWINLSIWNAIIREADRKTLYLEFSSTPSEAEVVNKLKGLLRLIKFRDRVELDGASKLENVESLLKGCRLSSCTVFLIVDNISDNTWEAVQRILHLGFGHGSKIIIISHTSKVLRRTLDSLRDGLHWACDSMAVPSINETEASEILMRTTRCCYGAAFTLFKSLTLKQMGTVKRLVHMCRHEDVWLPVVMKAVGARLLKYETGDLEEWERDLESFWTRVKTYEQSAVIEALLGDNFKALANEHRQLLFLDVALFILHLKRILMQ